MPTDTSKLTKVFIIGLYSIPSSGCLIIAITQEINTSVLSMTKNSLNSDTLLENSNSLLSIILLIP